MNDQFQLGDNVKGRAPIETALVTLQNDLSQLHSEIDIMCGKVTTVCRPTEGPITKAPVDHSGGSSMVHLLDELHYGLVAAIGRLSDLSQSVEL